jgi:hypothetical protein
MSRPKSQATLDREEKKRRKSLIKQAKDKARAFKAERKRLKILAKNAEIKAMSFPQTSFAEARHRKVMLNCSVCHQIEKGIEPAISAQYVCETCRQKGGEKQKRFQELEGLMTGGGKITRRMSQRLSSPLQNNLFGGSSD